MHGKPVICFIPLEDIEAKHFQTVHSLPHFREFQKEKDVIVVKSGEELKSKVRLFEKMEDKSSKKMKMMSKKYVSSFKSSYTDRL